MVAMNAETFEEDVNSLLPGGYLVYDNSKELPKSLLRPDINLIGVPISTMLLSEFSIQKQRNLFKILLIWECWPALSILSSR